MFAGDTPDRRFHRSAATGRNIAAVGALVATLHLRTRADGDLTEVWLAPAHGGLPVKIRHVDRKGDTFEQTADTLEIQG